MPNRSRLFSWLTLAALCSILAFAGWRLATRVAPVRTSGELVVVTRNSPSTWYEDASGRPTGLEYDLATQFARQLGLKVRFLVVGSNREMLAALANHQAHLAAGLAETPSRRRLFDFGPPYQSVVRQLVCHADATRPGPVASLSGKTVEVAADDGWTDELRTLAVQWPQVRWKVNPGVAPEDLLAMVENGDVACAVANDNVVRIERIFDPDIAVVHAIGAPEPMAWAFPKDADPWLVQQAQAFFARIKADGILKQLLDRYYGHVDRLDRVDIHSFMDKLNTVLPKLVPLFKSAQSVTGIDWRLLAALSYQESHWDPQATSPTGVRGMMMLTDSTAGEMKVADRLDPQQDIPAGAAYLRLLKQQLPTAIKPPDRDWLALAAYNIGIGHLDDAMALARRRKLNPDDWDSLKQVLPLLAREAIAAGLPHGIARGGETVVFVENIRTYFDILVHQDRTQPPAW